MKTGMTKAHRKDCFTVIMWKILAVWWRKELPVGGVKQKGHGKTWKVQSLLSCTWKGNKRRVLCICEIKEWTSKCDKSHVNLMWNEKTLAEISQKQNNWSEWIQGGVLLCLEGAVLSCLLDNRAVFVMMHTFWHWANFGQFWAVAATMGMSILKM